MDINRVDEHIKAISIGLFDWMEKNKEKVQKLMNYFKEKTKRLRLLDLTVVETLHEKSKFYDLFKKYFENEEEFKNFSKDEDKIRRIIEYYLKEQERMRNNTFRNNNVFPIFYSNFYDSPENTNYFKVYINFNDLSNYFIKSYKDKDEELLQKIGDAGEHYAYLYLIEEYKKKGYIQDDQENNFNSIKLTKKNCNDFVEIKLCNTSFSKQPGYDIKIINKENGKVITKYVEVKTHTKTSIYRGKIKLSYEQFCTYRKYKDYYTVIVMTALFYGDEIKCELNRNFDTFYFYEGNEVRPQYGDYCFEFDE